MASVKKRGGENYYAKYRDHTGKQVDHVIPATKKVEAQEIANDLERKAKRQRMGLEPMPDTDGGGTVAEMLNDWLSKQSKKLKAHEKNTGVIERHLLTSPLAPMLLAKVRPSDIEKFLDAKDDTLGAQTVNHLRSFLSRGFNAAIRLDRFAGPNPVAKVSKRKVPKHLHDYLRPEEIPSVLAAVNEGWRHLFATAIFTGLRKGELFALRKVDVDLPRRLLTVAGSHDNDTTKGGHTDVIPIATELVPFLEQAMARSPSELVFPAPDGGQWRADTDLPSVLRTALKRAEIVTGWKHVCRRKGCGFNILANDKAERRCDKCNMRLWPKAQVRPIRFHDLRHSTASLLVMKGASLAAVQKILRHADIQTTIKTYTHLDPKWLHAEVNRLALLPEGFELIPASVETRETHETLFQAIQRSENTAQADETNETRETRVSDRSGNMDLAVGAPQGVTHGGEAQGTNRVQGTAHDEASALNTGANINDSEGKNGARYWSRTSDLRLRSPYTPDTEEHRSLPKHRENKGFQHTTHSEASRSKPLFATPQGTNRVQGSSPSLTVHRGGARDLLTVADVARRLGVKPITVYRLCERGALPCIRVSNAIRVAPGDLDAFIHSNKSK